MADREVACPDCCGSGKADELPGNAPCARCHGKGVLLVPACPCCSGTGAHPYQRPYAVPDPPETPAP